MAAPTELDIIAALRPLTEPTVAQNLSDDGAFFQLERCAVSVDQGVLGVHLPESAPLGLLLAKTLLRSLADCFAMGARPRYWLCSCALSSEAALEFVAKPEAIALLAELQSRYQVQLIGGDTVAVQGPASCSVTIIGEPVLATRRCHARSGYRLFLLGELGRAGRGYFQMPSGLPPQLADWLSVACPDFQHYILPHPPVAAVDALLPLQQVPDPVALIDISDGVVRDAHRLGTACVPCWHPPFLRRLAQEPALSFGDDYALLLALSERSCDALREHGQQLWTQLTELGHLQTGVQQAASGHLHTLA